MFVTLATEKVQRLLPEEALNAVRERSRSAGKRKKQGGTEVEVVVSDRREGRGALNGDRRYVLMHAQSSRLINPKKLRQKSTGEFETVTGDDCGERET